MSKINFDSHKLSYHPERLADLLDGNNVKPIYAEISPTSNCNHRCVFCHYNYLGHSGMFPEKRMFSLIRELKDAGVKSVVFAGVGEPLLNRETVPAVELTKKLGLDVAMSTNGVLLRNEDMNILAESLTWIRFSFNGGTAETYKKIHKSKEGDFDKALSNIRKLCETRTAINSGLTVGVQYLLLPDNMNEVVEIAVEMKRLGVDYFTVKHFYDHSENEFSIDNSVFTDEYLSDLKSKAKEISSDSFSFIVRADAESNRSRVYDKCYGMPFIVYIREDGNLYGCFSYQHDEKTSFGNILKSDFKSVWYSDKMKEALDYINNSIDKNSCQPSCRHHQINNYLWEIMNPSLQHINFI